MGSEIYRQVRAYACKVNDVPRTSAVRLYCERDKQCWGLQVRGAMKLNNSLREGRDFIVAHASLSLEDLKALRDAVDAAIAEVTKFPEVGQRVVTVGCNAEDSDAGVVHSVRADGNVIVGWDSGVTTPCDVLRLRAEGSVGK